MPCPSTIHLGDDRVLSCALDADHDGPTHQDEHGEAWAKMLDEPDVLHAPLAAAEGGGWDQWREYADDSAP